MSKPTPGPWYANRNGVHIKKGTAGLCVACAYDPNEPNQSNDVCHANARLIAAAPDLLAACKLALSTDGCVLAMEVGCAIEEALAKAEATHE